MTSLVRPIVLESCQTTSLCGRRRSFINPLAIVPEYLSDSPSAPEDSAVFDETSQCEVITTKVEPPPDFIVPILSPISDAHMSDYASKITIVRHYSTLPMIGTCDASSPISTSPHTTLASRKHSFTEFLEESKPEQIKLERLRWRLASGFFAYFMCGWGDGVTGTVIPYFMADFHINFMFSSLLYAGSTIGYLTGTLLVELIINQLGRFSLTNGHWSWFPRFSFLPQFLSANNPRTVIGYSPSQARLLSLLVSSCLHGMFFVTMGSKGGYWVSFCAYALAAFARAILSASLLVSFLPVMVWLASDACIERNAYFASSFKPSLGYAFGLWSLGGVVSPLVCQTIIATGIPWSHFYLGSLVLSAFNVIFLVMTFKPTTTEFLCDQENALIMANRLAQDSDAMEAMSPTSKPGSEGMQDNNVPYKRKSTLWHTLSFPYQWAVSIFVLLYCGCETTTQGFMVTYLLGMRHADRKTVGYVTSGFWGGITIGRFLWGHYTAKLTYSQRKLVIQGCIRKVFSDLRGIMKLRIYPVIGLTMQLLIWFVNSNVQNAFYTSIIGLVYGPIFPASLTLANDILPPDIRMVSMAIISLNGSFGAALFPFVAGLISSIRGIHTLTFITVPLASAIACLWFLFPSKIPRRTTVD